jgi:FtsH-binding integral membrane protein
MSPIINTPQKVWVGIVLMMAALAVPVAGYFRSQKMSGDFGPIAHMLVTLGVGIVLSVIGIVCTFIGGRQKPRSLPTKSAIVAASLFLVPTVYLGIELVRVFAE